MSKTFYTAVRTGPKGALIAQASYLPYLKKVAVCSSAEQAQQLVDELNGTNTIHVDVVREALKLLGLATNEGTAQAAALLRVAIGEPGE